MTDSTALIATLFLVAVATLVVFSVISYRRERRRLKQPPGASTGSARAASAPPGSRVLSASQARTLATSLQSSGAQWPEIVLVLNPRQDAQAERILVAIRGPHLFDPNTGLTVIRHGCDLALARDPNASLLSALVEAKESMDKVIRAGD